jgi:hypothetical protein
VFSSCPLGLPEEGSASEANLAQELMPGKYGNLALLTRFLFFPINTAGWSISQANKLFGL